MAALGRRRGLGDLDRFVCADEDYQEVEDLQEELEEAEEEGDEERVEELRGALRGRLAAHDPGEVIAVVRGLIRHLEATPDDLETGLAEVVLVELRAYEIALGRAGAAGRRVFFTPY